MTTRESVRESVIASVMCMPDVGVPRSAAASRVATDVMRVVDGYASSQRALIEGQISAHVATREQAARAEERELAAARVWSAFGECCDPTDQCPQNANAWSVMRVVLGATGDEEADAPIEGKIAQIISPVEDGDEGDTR